MNSIQPSKETSFRECIVEKARLLNRAFSRDGIILFIILGIASALFIAEFVSFLKNNSDKPPIQFMNWRLLACKYEFA